MPTAPRIDTDPWERTREWTEVAFESPVVTVTSATAVYESPAEAERIEPYAPADIDESPRSVFTTGLGFDPPPPVDKTPGALLDIAARYAAREFEKSLGEDGLEDVDRTGTQEMRLRGRSTARAFQYDAGYPLSVGGTTRTTLDVRVWAALWPTEDAFAMAGGIYPLEDLETALARAGVTAETSLRARPAADRREIFERIREAAR